MKKIQNKLLMLLLLVIFIIPINIYAYTDKVYLGGQNLGIEAKSNGIMIVGFYKINGTSPGEKANLKLGDLILKVNDKDINNISDLSENSDIESIKITYRRAGKNYETYLDLVLDEGVYKTGLYVKDKIIGIGTLTFIDPETLIYGALGHQINEGTTGLKLEIKDGKIFKSVVTDINRSDINSPGEKNAQYYTETNYGTIYKNTISGIYGKYNNQIKSSLIEVAQNNEVETGKAFIKTVVDGETEEQFEINIIKIDKNDPTKNILFEVVDENLLKISNGIVQGMSGSPIIQNNKIVGAVTHVVVDNPRKGFGIFITTMLEEANKKSD